MENDIPTVDRIRLFQLITQRGMRTVSLGSNCYMKRWTEYLGVSQETHFFDYIGTRGFSLYHLLAFDFDQLFHYPHYALMKIVKSEPGTFITHNKYYLSFAHSFPGNQLTPFAFQRFSSQYMRRLGRLKEILRGNSGQGPVLFLRLEESPDRYNDEYYLRASEGLNEFEYLVMFSKLLLEKYPKLDYKILFVHSLSAYPDPIYLNESRILMIPKGKIHPSHWGTCHLDLSHIILPHYDFIHQILCR